MIHKHSYRQAWLSACVALLVTNNAMAADSDRWFRVELLVFSNESSHTTERWEATPALAYPNAARFLVEPGRIATNLRQHPGHSELNEYGRQIITTGSGTDTSVAAAAAGGRAPTGDPAAPTGSETAAIPTPPAMVPADSVAPALLPTPYVILPEQQQEFRGKAATMQRSGRYQLLFHETWVQPVADESRTLPVVLDRSGDGGPWPRLQGTIKLYLSRYLHVQTNLWLNTFGNYLPGEWRMPAPPLGPPSLLIEDAADVAFEEPAQQWSAVAQNEVTAPDANDMQILPEVDPGPVYPYRHAVLLRQKRRMRSTEVHYIDHPLFGLVIKVTPLSEEELQVLALEEQQDAGAMAQEL